MNKFIPKSFPGRKTAGFTLIELLAVVLIIGILASVALPQYQKAVAKARLSGFVQQAYALRNALKMYKLANGTNARKISDLDIWDSVQNESQSTGQQAFIGKRLFADVGGHYIRTYINLPGYQGWCCDFHWDGTYGFCYTYTEQGSALAESLGWEKDSGSAYPYLIGRKSDWM